MQTFQWMVVAIAVTIAGAQVRSEPSSSGSNGLNGAWHLVRIDAPGPDGRLAPTPKGPVLTT
jgi:hypothetical protein